MARAAKVLYVELEPEDRVLIERLTVEKGLAEGKPVSMSDVVRGLIRKAGRARPVGGRARS